MKAIVAENLTFSHRNAERPLFEGLNLEIESGRITAITGRSGCGKTTLCQIICGIIPQSIKGDLSGSVYLYGKKTGELSIAERGEMVGYVFQNPSVQLFSPTIEDELVFGPENLCLEQEGIEARLETVLNQLSIRSLLYKNPTQLSLGQQQLVALAAVLMLEPKILICDEVFAYLDQQNAERVKALFLKMREMGRTILLVSHERTHVDIADTVIQL